MRQLLEVRNLRDFNRFLKIAAVRTAQLVSMNSMAADVGVSVNTIKSWLAVLDASGIVKLVEPYFRNLGKRLVKTPKLYMLDTGLACYLSGLRKSSDLAQSALLGPMFETHVLCQIVRNSANAGHRADVYFYRDHHGYKIDFVIPIGEKLKLIECKWAESPSHVAEMFAPMLRLLGEENILLQAVVNSGRGCRSGPGGSHLVDSVDLSWLH